MILILVYEGNRVFDIAGNIGWHFINIVKVKMKAQSPVI